MRCSPDKDSTRNYVNAHISAQAESSLGSFEVLNVMLCCSSGTKKEGAEQLKPVLERP